MPSLVKYLVSFRPFFISSRLAKASFCEDALKKVFALESELKIASLNSSIFLYYTRAQQNHLCICVDNFSLICYTPNGVQKIPKTRRVYEKNNLGFKFCVDFCNSWVCPTAISENRHIRAHRRTKSPIR